MIFLCCHPALSRAGRMALTLKAVGGFGVDEIAAALLTRPLAIAQQLVRAKRLIRARGLRFELPATAALAERLESVLDVLYLLFTEGYQAHLGERLTRAALCEEAVRLTRLLLESPATRQPAVHALLALMLLQGSRLPARADAEGDVLRLDEQDRSRWSREAIREGFEHLERSSAGNRVTAYHVEAAIAACHAATVHGGAADWPRVLELYDELLVIKPSPVVALNRALALAMVKGPRAGISALGRLARHRALRGYHLLPAALGALWQRAGDETRAARCYRTAERQAASEPTRRFLAAQAARLRPRARRADGARAAARARGRRPASTPLTPRSPGPR
jgi:RNA polymerase sigma-70 factor (ECF subfamily)